MPLNVLPGATPQPAAEPLTSACVNDTGPVDACHAPMVNPTGVDQPVSTATGAPVPLPPVVRTWLVAGPEPKAVLPLMNSVCSPAPSSGLIRSKV